MAFNINPGKQQFSATAAQTVFTFNFAIFASTDLKVYKTLAGAVADDTADLLTLSTHYTVSINGTLGGTVTLLSGASLNDTITIVRVLPVTRTTDYVTNGDLYADTLDLDQDYQTYLVQDGYVQLERAIIIPESLSGVSINIPAPIADAYLRWNATADALENDDTIPQKLIDSQTAATTATSQAGIATTQAGLASTSATNAQLRAWEAEAERLTADSYATEAEDVPVNIVTSDGDGTFTYTPTSPAEYSALHWSAKSALSALGSAVNISVTPSGNISSTNVQNALNELDTEKAPLASPALTGDVSINGVNIGVYPYRNRLINGAMNVNQINGTTAVTPTVSAFISDQYYASSSQASKLTFQQVIDAPSGFKYSTKITVASQYSPLATDSFALYQKIEGQNITDFKFGTAGAVTINTSLYIKGSVAGTYSVSIKNGSSDRSYIGTITVGTSWSKVAINLVGANDGTWSTDNTAGLILTIDLGSGSNYNTTAGTWQNGNFLRTADSVTFVNQVAGSTLNITGVQLEKVPTGATQGTDYEWLSYDEELRRCMRYYELFPCAYLGYALSTNSCGVAVSFKVEKRVIPTVTLKTDAIYGPNLNSASTVVTTYDTSGIRIYRNASATGALYWSGLYLANSQL